MIKGKAPEWHHPRNTTLISKGVFCRTHRQQRGLAASTIYGQLEQAIHAGESVDINRFMTAEQQTHIASTFAQTGFGNLTGAKELLGDLYDYGQLRLFRALHAKTGQ